MNSRERVLAALNFEQPDRLPKDLGGMLSTGISAFAYPGLVHALGLPWRRAKIHDTMQMLALPDMDVLDALGCDVVTIHEGMTNAFEQDIWNDYDFNGRLQARVRYPEKFSVREDGMIVQSEGATSYFRDTSDMFMPPQAYVFDKAHGGQPMDLSAELPKLDLDIFAEALKKGLYTEAEVENLVSVCKKARSSTDKAIFMSGKISSGIGIASYYGIAIFPMLCMLEPDYVWKMHEIIIRHKTQQFEMLLPKIKDYIDVLMVAADDWGTQNSLVASGDTYRKLFLPFNRQINQIVHSMAPNVKTFLHSCGAIYPLIDDFIETGFDIINPVQWSAGTNTVSQWKDKCRKRIAMWGGGVNSQITLPYCSVKDICDEIRKTVPILARDNGYIFNSIHNILAEIEPEKVIALYKTASEF